MKSFLEIMAQRQSFPKLCDPAPDKKTMNKIFNASLRAPDHMQLRPWRFLNIEGIAREKLGDLFAKHASSSNPNNTLELEKSASKKALRAPLVIVGIVCYQENERVPRWEQMVAATGVMHNISLGVFASGFGSVWRTGAFSSSKIVKSGLNIGENEDITGFLYVGSRPETSRRPKALNASDYFSEWDGR